MGRQPLAPWALDGIDCPRCENRGYLHRVDGNGVLWSRECRCMSERRAIRSRRKQSDTGVVIILARL